MEWQTTLDEYEKLIIRMNTPRFFNLQFSRFAFGVSVDVLAFSSINFLRYLEAILCYDLAIRCFFLFVFLTLILVFKL